MGTPELGFGSITEASARSLSAQKVPRNQSPLSTSETTGAVHASGMEIWDTGVMFDATGRYRYRYLRKGTERLACQVCFEESLQDGELHDPSGFVDRFGLLQSTVVDGPASNLRHAARHASWTTLCITDYHQYTSQVSFHLSPHLSGSLSLIWYR